MNISGRIVPLFIGQHHLTICEPDIFKYAAALKLQFSWLVAHYHIVDKVTISWSMNEVDDAFLVFLAQIYILV